jgi:hypothetical protein
VLVLVLLMHQLVTEHSRLTTCTLYAYLFTPDVEMDVWDLGRSALPPSHANINPKDKLVLLAEWLTSTGGPQPKMFLKKKQKTKQ